MISEDAKRLIENKPVAIATCVLGVPNISVAAFVKVVDDKVVVTDNYMARTVQNIGKNNKIGLAVWGEDWVGYKISGTAVYENSGKWLDFVKNMPENEGLPAKGVLIISVESIRKIGE